jgi:acyl carrier protein
MTSTPPGQLVKTVVREVLEQKGTADQDVRDESKLYEEGLGLDSLDTATLSVALEREFGDDPYTQGQFPRTVGELVQYFEGRS